VSRSDTIGLALWLVLMLPWRVNATAAPSPSALGGEPLRTFGQQNVRQPDITASTRPPTMDYPRVLGALAAVIGLILLLRWCGRLFFPAAGARGSSRAVEVLGRSPVSPRQQVMLLRVGRRLIVVGDSGSQLSSLCEITDPDEVAAMVGQLRDERAAPASRAFVAMFGRSRRRFAPPEEAPEQAPPLDDPEDEAPVASAREELSGLRERVRLLAQHFKSSLVLAILPAVIVLSATGSSAAQEKSAGPAEAASAFTTGTPTPPSQSTPFKLPDLTNRENVSSALQIIFLLTVLSLAPAILVMMTSFTRIIIVLSLLRQALGTQQLPPNQVLIGLSLFMTFLVMGPTWDRVNNEALKPYMDGQIDQTTALKSASGPVRDFMIKQIKAGDNDDDVRLFTDAAGQPPPANWDEVRTMTLIPAFMLSELKTAFLLGFKIYLPFLIIDMVISTVLISMGMMMLPPVLISLPFKLLLFVLVNGWHLITASLIGSFIR